MFHNGQRVRSLNGASQGAVVKRGPDYVIKMLGGDEVKPQWYVAWDNAPAGTGPELVVEEVLVATETTG
ncbi:hypothetical protein LRS13_13465 [Svornostia abyssi]|uniref:DUF1918 domain-containing protein n=1 Tax=Svornostia abyssi TaxID=2898438 RepID=A0ABY5PAY0_9ACTN|nr:hypothetical protein LRS13_13465 [Parviterribacteraceae bacterium J379]